MHTKEPWYVDGTEIRSSQKDDITGEDIVIVACYGAMGGDDIPADKRRIVAAVNACEGIPTKALEEGVIRGLLEVLKDITFLASLENRNFTITYDDAVMTRARAVIAKAEGDPK